MASKAQLSIGNRADDRDLRERLARVRVLIADRDIRTANLVQKILFSFGLRNIEVTNDGEGALDFLRSHPFDFLITEWNMHPFDGIALVKAIRTARDDHRIRRDIPIIMLTARAELDSVQEARDAGITEFVAKPFSAKTISSRIIQIIDNPRAFVESTAYVGPCRRRRGEPPPGVEDRRGRGAKPDSQVIPPNYALREQLGGAPASAIFNETSVTTAQNELMKSQGDFVVWARTEIINLQAAFAALQSAPANGKAQQALLSAAYAIKSQAGIFGYGLGTEVAGMLLTYVGNHLPPSVNHLLVIGKHIEAITVIFNQNVEQHGRSIARDVIDSLHKLVAKME